MKHFFKLLVSSSVLAGFAVLTFYYFDERQLSSMIEKVLHQPSLLVAVFLVYFLSFVLKAAAWMFYLKGRIRFSTCLIGILYSLLLNHLSPVKAGDLIRAKIASTREKQLGNDEAFHSVVMLRLLDMLCLLGMAAAGLWALKVEFQFPMWLAAAACLFNLAVLFAVHRFATRFLKKHLELFKQAFSGKNGLFIIACTLLSWVLEAGVLYGTVRMMAADELSLLAAVFANSVTIAGQVLQITPGGIGNYESFLVFALTLFQFPVKESYTIAVITHALKFVFSYLAGAAVFLIYPISFQTVKDWVKARRVKK